MGFMAKKSFSAAVNIKRLMFYMVLIIPFTIGSLEVNTTIGFNGYYHPGKWTPITVIVSNEGRPVKGELIIELPKKDYFNKGSLIEYKKEINLPGKSRKQFSFVVPIDRVTGKVTVRIKADDIDVFSREIDLSSRKLRGDFVLCLSRRASLDFIQKEPFLTGRNRLQVLYPHSELLPEKWTGYDGVSLIVIHDAPLRMKDSQIKALNMWVYSGGTLIISAGPHFTASHGRILDPILPVTYQGLIRREKLPSLAEYTEANIESPGGFLLTEANNRTGNVLIEEDGIPILVEEKRGRGSVFFLAFDYADKKFNSFGRDKLWKTMTENVVAPESIPFEHGNIFYNELVTQSLKSADNILVSKKVIVPAVGVYFCSVLLFIYLGRKPKRAGLTISFFIIMPVFFTVIYYFAFFHVLQQSDALFMDVSVINTEINKTTGYIDKEIILVSLDESVQRINIQDKLAVIQQMETHGVSLLEKSEDNITQIEGIRINRWGYQSFHIHAQIDFPIVGTFFMDDNIIELSLINKTEHTVLDGVLFYRNIPVYSGDFPPDGKISTTLQLNKYSSLSVPDVKWNYFAGTDQSAKQAVIDYLISPGGPEIMKSRSKIVFAGWLEESPIRVIKNE